MKDKKEHLKIDLDFLDKETPKEPQPAPADADSSSAARPATTPVSTGYKHNWRNIAIIGGIVLVIIWAIASSDDSSTNSTSSGSYVPTTQTSNYNSGSGTVIRGDYSCSSYAASRVDALSPSESEATLTSAQNALERRTNYLKNLKDEIDSSYVNEYSDQWQIDDYNQKVDEYNSLLPAYKRDMAGLDSRIDSYNAQIEARNNYLSQNCTRR